MKQQHSRLPTTVVMAGLSLCVCALAGCEWVLPDAVVRGEVAPSGPRRVYALGRLEPAGGVISISAIPGERIAEIDPDIVENQPAPSNGVLGKLASFDLRAAQIDALQARLELAQEKRLLEIELATAQLKQAEATLAQTEAKAAEFDIQEPKLEVLKRASQIAREEYNRLAELREKDADLVTPHQLAKQENKTQLAEQEYLIASKSMISAKVAAKKAVEAAEANKLVAANNVVRLGSPDAPGPLDEAAAIRKEINVAQNTLAQSILWTPDADYDREQVAAVECEAGDDPGRFTVLKVYSQAGEFVTQMPIMQVADLERMVCIAEVYEADVKAIRTGQGVTVRSPAFGEGFSDGPADKAGVRSGGMRGTVETIGGIIAPPGVSNRNPLAPADRSVVEVRIAITDESAVEHARTRVGLQVTVEFDPPAAEKEAPAKKESEGVAAAG
ncbi:MAG: hypothetical protein AAGA92_15045 [Planctomycetota bacterium]